MNVGVQVVKLLSIYLFYLFIFAYKESYRRDLRNLHNVLTSCGSTRLRQA